MKWKRFLNFIVLAVFALAGVAAVQWYSQQLATATFDDTDVLVVERAAPHALRSATLANLRTYMQIGVPTTNNLASTNYVNAATNGLATGLASTNYVNTATNGLATTNYVNTATNGLASTNYANTLTNSLASTNYANTLTNSLASTNYANTLTNSLASTNYANTLTNSLASTNYANTLTNSLASTNYANTLTNSLASTNYVNTATNSLASTNYVNDAITNLVTTNLTVNNVSKMYGAQTNFSGAYSLASTTNSPSTLEFATAGWVRSLLGSGAHYYNSTNLAPGWLPTKGDAQPFLYIPDIPAPAVRTYASAYLTNNGYLGGIAITNLTQFEGPFVVATYLGFAGGIATPTITIKPEIYYSYDNGTNLLGDWDTQAQSITHGQTNLYSWVISVPSTVSTGGTFTVYRLFKIVSASFGGSPTLSVHVGTNTASHISFTQPVVAGGTYSGTFVGDGSGLTNLNALSPLQVTNAITDATNGLTGGSLSPVAFGLANLASAMGSNTFWENPNGMVVKSDFRQNVIPFTISYNYGGGSAAASSGGSYRVSIYPTNVNSYSAMRYGTAPVVWGSNFICDASVWCNGVELAQFDIGLLTANVGVDDDTNAVRWLGNTNYSSYWIAECTYDSTSSYWTSSVAVGITPARLSIYAASTNAVNFYTNGVWACQITNNIPGGHLLIPSGRASSTGSTGASTSQQFYFDYWWSVFD